MSASHEHVLPAPVTLETARTKVIDRLAGNGIGLEATTKLLEEGIAPGLNRSGRKNYYGFVTGGVTPAARLADNLVTKYDQNVSVHLPDETLSTVVEDAALRMLCDLIGLSTDTTLERGQQSWTHRTFTTGATASNVLGLACARDYTIQLAARQHGESASTAEHGISKAMQIAQLDEIQILTTLPHSSLGKAASIVGLGRGSFKDVGREGAPHLIDLPKLTAALARPRTASIVAISCAEVNAGLFATDGDTITAIRRECDKYGAWIHVDAAFGLLARVLPEESEYQLINSGVAKIELADSITGDAHKLLNVPYDCGIFFSRHLGVATEVFQNSNAAYLNSPVAHGTGAFIPSPLNIGIENSRRFRALPVYASLVAYGRSWYRTMLEKQIELARGIASFILQEPRFELLPTSSHHAANEERLRSIYVIVIFRAKDTAINSGLTKRINATREIYVSPTQWDGQPATRFAVASWETDVEKDLQLIKKVLTAVLEQ